jgi:hypothetical protein
VSKRLDLYIENMEWQMGKLLGELRDLPPVVQLSAEQMAWTPPEISNPLSWLIRHFADVMWETYGFASGEFVPANLSQSGIPEGWLKNLSYDKSAPGPGPTGADHAAYLERAWNALRTYLVENEPDWESVQVVRPPDQLKTMWWMLTHIQLDGAYHTGQASYLKMLLAAR